MINGKWTHALLDNTEALICTQAEGSDLSCHPFTQNAAQLSLELAATAYDLEIAPWQEAGWTDFSYQVDHTLLTGSKVNAGEEAPFRHRISGFLHKLAQQRLHRSNPFSQLYGTWRQKEKSDTCKALVMAHALPGGQYLIAIGFMGTGKRLHDWISNFRIHREADMHQGFMQLSREFESRCDEIRFPQIARALQIDRLTLSTIIQECTQPGSRFRIWMSGHSQGAAVMQVFTRHLLDQGVLPQYIQGYGFASPTVTYTRTYSQDPLHHLICSDDLTPRIGAKYHIGRCYVLPMTHALRALCYQDHWQKDGFPDMILHIGWLTDTRQSILYLMGFLRALTQLEDGEAHQVLNALGSKFMPGILIDWLGDNTHRYIQRLMRHLRMTYTSITGQNGIPFMQVLYYERHILAGMHHAGASRFASLLMLALSQPHHLRNRKGGLSTYQRMVLDQYSHIRLMDASQNNWPVLSRPFQAVKGKASSPRFARLSWLKSRRRI